eukprot:scaffold77903_cov17-Tisochrysis_lutea.AAC.1
MSRKGDVSCQAVHEPLLGLPFIGDFTSRSARDRSDALHTCSLQRQHRSETIPSIAQTGNVKWPCRGSKLCHLLAHTQQLLQQVIARKTSRVADKSKRRSCPECCVTIPGSLPDEHLSFMHM